MAPGYGVNQCLAFQEESARENYLSYGPDAEASECLSSVTKEEMGCWAHNTIIVVYTIPQVAEKQLKWNKKG